MIDYIDFINSKDISHRFALCKWKATITVNQFVDDHYRIFGRADRSDRPTNQARLVDYDFSSGKTVPIEFDIKLETREFKMKSGYRELEFIYPKHATHVVVDKETEEFGLLDIPIFVRAIGDAIFIFEKDGMVLLEDSEQKIGIKAKMIKINELVEVV